jgi:serine protease Do
LQGVYKVKVVDNLLRRHPKMALWYLGRTIAVAVLLIAQFSTAAPAISQDPTHPLRALQESFREVSRSVKPAVVNVSTVKIVNETRLGPGLDPFFQGHPLREFLGDEFFRQFFGAPGGSRHFRQQGLGSGFIVDPRGFIVTNRHVIKGADEIQVTLASDKKYKARVVYDDPKTDVAVIKIDGANFPVTKLGDSQTLEVGDWVLAIGNPLGLTQTVTAGIVSAKGRSLGISDVRDFIQTDAAINVGNSGGPLVNIDGQVVGMNTAIASGSGGNIGIGFAIPSNVLKKVISASLGESPAEYKHLKRQQPHAVAPRNSGRPGPQWHQPLRSPRPLGDRDI